MSFQSSSCISKKPPSANSGLYGAAPSASASRAYSSGSSRSSTYLQRSSGLSYNSATLHKPTLPQQQQSFSSSSAMGNIRSSLAASRLASPSPTVSRSSPYTLASKPGLSEPLVPGKPRSNSTFTGISASSGNSSSSNVGGAGGSDQAVTTFSTSRNAVASPVGPRTTRSSTHPSNPLTSTFGAMMRRSSSEVSNPATATAASVSSPNPRTSTAALDQMVEKLELQRRAIAEQTRMIQNTNWGSASSPLSLNSTSILHNSSHNSSNININNNDDDGFSAGISGAVRLQNGSATSDLLAPGLNQKGLIPSPGAAHFHQPVIMNPSHSSGRMSMHFGPALPSSPSPFSLTPATTGPGNNSNGNGNNNHMNHGHSPSLHTANSGLQNPRTASPQLTGSPPMDHLGRLSPLQQYNGRLSPISPSFHNSNSPPSSSSPSSVHSTSPVAASGTGDGISPRKPTSVALAGFRNLGNTCFMNSALQCLVSTSSFTKYFLAREYRHDLNNTRGMKGSLAVEYGELIAEMGRVQNRGCVSPSAFRSLFVRWAPRFQGYAQQDAQEFLRAALDGLHEDLNRTRVQPAYEELKDMDGESAFDQSERWWNHFRARNNSVVLDTFGGQLKSTVKCTKCKTKSVAFDPFLDFSVPIPKKYTTKNSCSIDDCLKEFFGVEDLGGNDKVFCKKCQKPREMEKQLALFRHPKILVLHIKRFSQSGFTYSKINTDVSFPMSEFDLSRHLDPDAKKLCQELGKPVYRLFAVVNHFGTASGGHYTAYGLRNNQWNLFDDSSVSDASPQQVKGPAAYILFYEQTP
ncbi:ubiquitin carboxyl-terminal hydrolase [Andalucia godoyi]|uniref:Ubiquitin carboxyl-terminal hydrolase n=1 Tax=Andalucia godoyi TaxID=505711 RepID=A0A8K0F2C3_ANDGO|nr:ubiquitin carboxyl-terminal hydrolase [Andalucia godoyi]|eukprot:ANDGO_00995.mRNA.1 ubiquitin carboxyl-terminal hydrolase